MEQDLKEIEGVTFNVAKKYSVVDRHMRSRPGGIIKSVPVKQHKRLGRWV